MTKNTIEKIITHNRRGFAAHQIWAMFDELERKHATTLRLLRELHDLVEANDAYDGEPYGLKHQICAHLAALQQEGAAK